MKQGTNARRSRGRSNGKRQPSRNSNYDSGGPEGRIRGNASQVHEKYLGLARESLLSDDRIASENYSQHAEHFYRIMTANAEAQSQKESQKSASNTNQNYTQNNNQNNNNQNEGPGDGQKDKNRSRRNRNNNRGNGPDGNRTQNPGNNQNAEATAESSNEQPEVNEEKQTQPVEEVKIEAPAEVAEAPKETDDDSKEPASA